MKMLYANFLLLTVTYSAEEQFVFCPLILINPFIAIKFPLLESETVKPFYGDK